jgi:hypothetical protein
MLIEMPIFRVFKAVPCDMICTTSTCILPPWYASILGYAIICTIQEALPTDIEIRELVNGKVNSLFHLPA